MTSSQEKFQWVGGDLVIGRRRVHLWLQFMLVVPFVGLYLYKGFRDAGLDWWLIGVGVAFLAGALFAIRAAAKNTRQLVVGPTEVTWKGGDVYAKKPGPPVRAPRAALTRVWVHGPARESVRRQKGSLWQVSLVLDSEGLPLDVAAAMMSTREDAVRVGSELAAKLGLPFEDRSG